MNIVDTNFFWGGGLLGGDLGWGAKMEGSEFAYCIYINPKRSNVLYLSMLFLPFKC